MSDPTVMTHSTVVHFVLEPDASAHEIDYMPQSWLCADCGADTAPGVPSRSEIGTGAKIDWHSGCEIYALEDAVWAKAGMTPRGGCLCIACVETRLGRALAPDDFLRDHPLNDPGLPGTERLKNRRGD